MGRSWRISASLSAKSCLVHCAAWFENRLAVTEMSWIYWVDGEAGAIWRVARDGTRRQRVIAQSAPIDAQPQDWLAGIYDDS